MTSTADGLTAHPIAGFATRLHQALDELAETAASSMTPAEQREALVELARGQARMEELRLRVLAAADHSDIAADSAATSTGAWVAHVTRQPRGQAHRDVTVAVALDEELGATRDALAVGAVDGAQARVIVGAVQALSRQAPDAVAADRSIPQRAEKHLIELAARYDAVALKRLGRHVLEVLEPEIADQALGKKLEAEEAAAARAAFLELFDNGDGTHAGRFKIPTLHAAMLLSALLERLDPSRLPGSGGSNATVVVTSTTTSSCRVWAPPTSAPANRSPRAWPVGSPARPASSPPSSGDWSTAAPSSWTWAASAACSASTSASPSRSSKGAAGPKRVAAPPPGATPITTFLGPAEDVA